MISRAPRSAVEVLGICRIVAGPDVGVVRYTGWSEVWMHRDGHERVAFPPMSAIRDVRDPETKFLAIRVVPGSTRWYPPALSTLHRGAHE